METTNRNTEMKNYPNDSRPMIDPNQDIANPIPQDGRPEIVQVVNHLQEIVRDFKSHSNWLNDLSTRIGGPVPSNPGQDPGVADPQNLLDALCVIRDSLANERDKQTDIANRIHRLI